MTPTFIRLENTFNAAMTDNGSPQTVFFDYRGVHLVTDNEYKYVQRTYAAEGIEIEDNEIEFYSMCGDLLDADVHTGTFKVENAFNDPDTGLPQVIWSLNTANLDFGNQLIYFKITTGANGYIYSSPFVLTADESNFTTQYWYKTNPDEYYLSIGLNMYPLNKKSQKELSQYNPISSGNIINTSLQITPFEKFETGIIWNGWLELFPTIFEERFVYSKPWFWDGLPVATSLFTPPESIDPQGLENFVQSEILLSRDYDYTLDPNAEPIIPPTPPIDAPEITLISVVRVDNNHVSLNFSYANFTPNYLNMQYSTDGINWISSGGSATSPRSLLAPNNNIINYYYRVSHELAVSNVKTIPFRTIIIDGVIKAETASGLTKFKIAYSLEEYDYTPKLIYEFSADNTEFRQSLYNDGTENPKEVFVADSITTEPYFRIRDDENGLISNVIQYTE